MLISSQQGGFTPTGEGSSHQSLAPSSSSTSHSSLNQSNSFFYNTSPLGAQTAVASSSSSDFPYRPSHPPVPPSPVVNTKQEWVLSYLIPLLVLSYLVPLWVLSYLIPLSAIISHTSMSAIISHTSMSAIIYHTSMSAIISHTVKVKMTFYISLVNGWLVSP